MELTGHRNVGRLKVRKGTDDSSRRQITSPVVVSANNEDTRVKALRLEQTEIPLVFCFPPVCLATGNLGPEGNSKCLVNLPLGQKKYIARGKRRWQSGKLVVGLFPAPFDIRGDVLLVPDLHACVSLFDKDNQPIVHLGDDADWIKEVKKFQVRSDPKRWPAGKFIHPHDACFDKDGNIFVVEWVHTGRVTLLRHLA